MTEERGYWAHDPRLGSTRWHGPLTRQEAHGPATIHFTLDKLARVESCLLPDGTRDRVRASLASDEGRDGQVVSWRRRLPDGRYEYGRIVVDAGIDVRFVPDPDLAPKSVPDDPVQDRFVVEVRSDPRLMALLRDDEFAREFYGAMCNTDWLKTDGSSTWGCTFREAGGLVADLRGRGEEYIDFYCSSEEGVVSPRVADELTRLGWFARPMS